MEILELKTENNIKFWHCPESSKILNYTRL